MAAAQGPSRYKLAVVVWLAIFPSVAIMLTLLKQFVGGLPTVVQAFILTVIVVPIAVIVIVPRLTRLMSGWLER